MCFVVRGCWSSLSKEFYSILVPNNGQVFHRHYMIDRKWVICESSAFKTLIKMGDMHR